MIRLLVIFSCTLCSFYQAVAGEEKPPDHSSNEIIEETTASDTALAREYLQKGLLFSEKQAFDSGAYYLGLSGAIYKQLGLWEKYVAASAHLVLNLIYLDQIDSASKINKQLIEIFRQEQLEDSLTFKRLLNFQGGIYSILKKLDSAIAVTEQLLALDKLSFNHQPDMFLGGTYHNIGTLYTDYEMPEKALQYYDSAEAIYYQLSGKGTEEAARLYSNKAIALKLMGNYEESLALNKRSYEIFESILKPDHPRLALALFNIANDLIDRNKSQEDPAEAIRYLQKGFEVLQQGNNLSHRYVTDYYRFLAKAYVNLQDYELAIKTLQEGLVKSIAINGENHAEQAQMYEELANIYINTQAFGLAAAYLDTSQQIYETSLGSDFRRIANIYNLKGLLFAERQQYDTALKHYQRALAYFTAAIDTNNVLTNPYAAALTAHENLFSILKNKAETLQKAYAAHPKTAYLQSSFDTYLLLAEYVRLSQKSFFDTHVKLAYAEKKSDFYEEGMEAGLTLYEKTHQQEILEKTLQLADHRKASLLLEVLESNKAKVFANLPPSLLDQERELKGAIHYTQQRLFEWKQAAEGEEDEPAIQALEVKLFNLKTDLGYLLKTFEQQYPAYHQLKYNHEPLTLAKLRQQLDNAHAVMLQYMVGESSSYVWLVGYDWIDYVQIPQTEALEEEIQAFINGLKHRDFNAYTTHGYLLYQTLLEPVLVKARQNRPSIDQLIIIPDGILGYVPFETLIQQIPEPGQGYKDLAYLIKDYEISYHYSAGLLALDRPKRSAPASTFIGFAPSFRDHTDQQLMAFHETVRSYLDSARALPFAEEEVSLIASLLDGEANIGSLATEHNFKRNAAHYGIIHLASHSMINDVDPLYSKLIFDAEHDSIEDGLLHTYELYNLQLNADLVCLSACNTGVGKYYKGEGIVSLARGFMYAGVPNVLMSLWAVSDRPTKDNMTLFYQELKKGHPYAQALRIAKLRYLEQADNITADPYYWGAFIYLGQPAKSTGWASGNSWLGTGIAVFILLVMTGMILLRRK